MKHSQFAINQRVFVKIQNKVKPYIVRQIRPNSIVVAREGTNYCPCWGIEFPLNDTEEMSRTILKNDTYVTLFVSEKDAYTEISHTASENQTPV